MINRRGFLTGIIAAACAPAIIRTPGLIMPIKASLVSSSLVTLCSTLWVATNPNGSIFEPQTYTQFEISPNHIPRIFAGDLVVLLEDGRIRRAEMSDLHGHTFVGVAAETQASA